MKYAIFLVLVSLQIVAKSEMLSCQTSSKNQFNVFKDINSKKNVVGFSSNEPNALITDADPLYKTISYSAALVQTGDLKNINSYFEPVMSAVYWTNYDRSLSRATGADVSKDAFLRISKTSKKSITGQARIPYLNNGKLMNVVCKSVKTGGGGNLEDGCVFCP